MITRLAPTPSGYLHRGNAVNFLLVAWLAEQLGGEIMLRIDDMDAARCRPEFIADVFRVLDWLGIEWQHGPATPGEFESSHALRARTVHYREELDLLRASGIETYACGCSRSDLRRAATRACPGDCRRLGLPLVAGETALRVRVPEHTVIDVAGRGVDLSASVGDFVVWRRDGMPAYHLASVVEDRDAGITHIVRGEDLVASTAAQVFLAPGLDAQAVAQAVFVHHALVTGSEGAKLSKSQLSSGPMDLTASLHAEVRRMAAHLGEPSGIGPRT